MALCTMIVTTCGLRVDITKKKKERAVSSTIHVIDKTRSDTLALGHGRRVLRRDDGLDRSRCERRQSHEQRSNVPLHCMHRQPISKKYRGFSNTSSRRTKVTEATTTTMYFIRHPFPMSDIPYRHRFMHSTIWFNKEVLSRDGSLYPIFSTPCVARCTCLHIKCHV